MFYQPYIKVSNPSLTEDEEYDSRVEGRLIKETAEVFTSTKKVEKLRVFLVLSIVVNILFLSISIFRIEKALLSPCRSEYGMSTELHLNWYLAYSNFELSRSNSDGAATMGPK